MGVTAASHAYHHVLDELLGIERLSRGEGRTDRFAASTLHAGVEAAGGGHVSVGHHLVARHHMVQVDQIPARYRRQTAEHGHRRWSPLTPQANAPHGTDRRQRQGSEDQDRQEGIEHDGSPHRRAGS